MSWQNEVDELGTVRNLARRMGGEDGIARQKQQGRLTVRERVDLLVDPGSFEEIMSTLGATEYDNDGRVASFTPDSQVIGFGRVDGRQVCVRGEDFTIAGGTGTGGAGTGKRTIEETALRMRLPLIRLQDGAGGSVRAGSRGRGAHRVDDPDTLPVTLREQGVVGSVDVPATAPTPSAPSVGRYDFASLRSESLRWSERGQESTMGGLLARVPTVCAVLGSCAGWVAVAAARGHFSVMVKDTSELFTGGPPLVRQALGIDLTKHELGGWRIQAELAGVINNVAENEEDAFGQIRRFLSYLPQNVWEQPPRAEPTDDPNRREEGLLSIIPREGPSEYDIRELIELVIDRKSTFEIAPSFGRSLVTMFARIDGYPVALIANDTHHDDGAQTAAASQKFERFVDLADTFHLPIVYLCDVPGLMVGPESEKQGNLRWAVRANRAVAEASVPFCTILLRRFAGVATGGSKLEGFAMRYAWPSAELGSHEGPEATPPVRRPEIAAETIDPRDTRPLLVNFVRDGYRVSATQLGPKLRVGARP